MACRPASSARARARLSKARAYGNAGEDAPEKATEDADETMRRGTTRRYKVTLLGLGTMGQRHARILKALEAHFDLAGAYDPNPAAATPEGTTRLGSEAEALSRAELVVVATPIDTHMGLVGRALAAGRHVFVEKPACSTATEARSALAMARAGAHLFVGHSERFNPVVRALAKLVRDERVLAIDLRRVGTSRPCASGVLVNLGVHDFDLATYLGGGEVTLRGAVGSGPSAAPGPDAAHVVFSTAAGAVGHIHVDRAAPTRQRAIELVTARWVYEGDLLAHRLVRIARSGPGRAARADVPLPIDEPLAAQAAAMAHALEGGAAREIAMGDDGVRALELAERAGVLCKWAEAWSASGDPAENLSVDARRC
jgi:predicted dehydrogenase